MNEDLDDQWETISFTPEDFIYRHHHYNVSLLGMHSLFYTRTLGAAWTSMGKNIWIWNEGKHPQGGIGIHASGLYKKRGSAPKTG